MPELPTGRTSDEPETQHQAHCDHPQAICSCTRQHLIREGMRLRELYFEVLNRANGMATGLSNLLVNLHARAEFHERTGAVVAAEENRIVIEAIEGILANPEASNG